MDMNHFDRPLNLLATAPSRRQVLGGVFGALVVGVLGSTAPVSAKGKKGKGKGKKKRRNGQAPLTGGPVARPDAFCLATGGAFGTSRVSQTFRALRSGQLTSASVVLVGYDTGAIDMEIWSVNQSNVPQAILAGTTIAVAAQAEPKQTVTGTFAAPATVVAGLRYALVITPQSGPDVYGVSLEGSQGNPCTDGNVFQLGIGGVPFRAELDWDVHFTTVVTG